MSDKLSSVVETKRKKTLTFVQEKVIHLLKVTLWNVKLLWKLWNVTPGSSSKKN